MFLFTRTTIYRFAILHSAVINRWNTGNILLLRVNNGGSSSSVSNCPGYTSTCTLFQYGNCQQYAYTYGCGVYLDEMTPSGTIASSMQVTSGSSSECYAAARVSNGIPHLA